MSITDELRAYTEKQIKWLDVSKVHYRKLFEIADRIDAEHESACAEAYGNGVMSVPIALDESAYVELPKDADGECIHVGDVMEFEHRGKMLVAPVDTIELSRDHEGYLWSIMVDHQCVRYSMGGLEMRHHKPPTVEDVLQELVVDWDCAPDGEDKAAVLKEYAAKLQLRGDAE